MYTRGCSSPAFHTDNQYGEVIQANGRCEEKLTWVTMCSFIVAQTDSHSKWIKKLDRVLDQNNAIEMFTENN